MQNINNKGLINVEIVVWVPNECNVETFWLNPKMPLIAIEASIVSLSYAFEPCPPNLYLTENYCYVSGSYASMNNRQLPKR